MVIDNFITVILSVIKTGLGLCDETDITVKGLEAIKSCERVYLEAYTSILMVPKEQLEKFYGKELIIADREMVESQSDEILLNANSLNIAFLVVGDPFGATTHTDLVIRARELNIPVTVIHNASIINAIGTCGLQLYNFGQTISIPFFTNTWKPDSFYDRIKENKDLGLHTLCLLAIQQLFEIEETRNQKVYTTESLAIGIARLGSSTDQQIKVGTLNQLLSQDFGPPLHSLVIVGSRVHILEIDFMRFFAVDKQLYNEIVKKDYGI
ncbi:5713_t:CDS:2 [Dentiscutata heterogama]|uniref:5713_t:CDS:1 n=1 Tax=Dentiscutata heterogama TaxID=1316150 RepID=A0ACA9N345_9GLOM|nr:5713_t:CDS:2 [Dentiscutata heterogama]